MHITHWLTHWLHRSCFSLLKYTYIYIHIYIRIPTHVSPFSFPSSYYIYAVFFDICFFLVSMAAWWCFEHNWPICACRLSFRLLSTCFEWLRLCLFAWIEFCWVICSFIIIWSQCVTRARSVLPVEAVLELVCSSFQSPLDRHCHHQHSHSRL